jgi:hypothetical protein
MSRNPDILSNSTFNYGNPLWEEALRQALRATSFVGVTVSANLYTYTLVLPLALNVSFVEMFTNDGYVLCAFLILTGSGQFRKSSEERPFPSYQAVPRYY